MWLLVGTCQAQIVKPQPITLADSTGTIATRHDGGKWMSTDPDKALEQLYQLYLGAVQERDAYLQVLNKTYAILRWIEPSGAIIDKEKFDQAVKALQ